MKNYAVRPSIPEDANQSLEAYPELARQLLYYRGIASPAEAHDFFNPDFVAHVHDPFLMLGMEKAVNRVLAAIDQKERICIYSDYDADGIPGGVLVADFFRKIGYENFENYIPHRHEEGFGLHSEAVSKIAERGAKLMITVDCGIADVEEVAHANKLGLEVIITDHHLPGEILPSAFAILDPQQPGETYPFKMLCGSGVAFKLIQALVRKNDFGQKEGFEKWMLDMVGIATCADMVPLRGENRALAHYGLKVLRKSRRIGLFVLLKKMGVNQANLTEDDIGFSIAPRINAASRMDAPQQAFNLLSTSSESEAIELAEHLNRINDERKGIVGSIVKEIKRHIAERMAEEMKKVIVMGNPDWRPSLLGLAANSLVEAHSRPVFLWGREGGSLIKGSCRSDGSVSLVEMMRAATPGVFEDFGGHAMAGGFSVSHEKIHFLEDELVSAYDRVRAETKNEQIFIDRELSLDDINWRTWMTLEKFAPFGIGNPKPLFLLRAAPVASIKKFGKEKNHLELGFQKSDGKKVNAICFFARESMFAGVQPGSPVDLVAVMEKSSFRGFSELRLRIVDLVPAESVLRNVASGVGAAS